MSPVAWLDDMGKPAWIALMIVSFIVFWPFGLVVLGYMAGSGRMFGCWTAQRGGEWRSRMREHAAGWCGPRARHGMRSSSSSGNRAFDEYREDTLRRLEEEEREFKEFLDRLRHAKDKAEFDQFMADMRGRRPTENGPAPQPQG
jgi:Protein of unknown function (DUF2852)